MVPYNALITGTFDATAERGRCRFIGGWGRALSLMMVIGSALLLPSSCQAGLIFPVATEASPQPFQSVDESRTLVNEQESGIGASETRDSNASKTPPARIDFPNHMAADTSGCGTPTSPAGGSSSGWLAACHVSVSDGCRAPDLSGAVLTETNLPLPTVAPSELLDPPRVAG